MAEKDMIRVLIVEDDPVQRELLCDALEMEQDIVCCGQAGDGVEALEALCREEPDVLLLDIIMPNMDGFDLLYQLRESSPPKRPHIIAISAFGQERIVQTALSQGADYFMLKPYRFDLLFHRIRTFAKEDTPERGVCVERAVSRAVINLEVPTNTFGFPYLGQALMILLTRQGTCLIGKDVYEVIAARNGTSAQNVEKSLRTVIQRAFEANSAELRRILRFGGVEGVTHLSNGRFLTLMAESLRHRDDPR